MPTATESRWDSWRDEFELRFVGWDGMNLPTILILKLLTVPHPGPAEFFCWKRPFSSVERRKS